MGARRARGAGGAPSAPKVTWLLLLWYRCGLRAGEAAATQNEPAHLRVVLNSTLSGAARPAAVSGVNLGASRVNWSPSHQATSAAVRNFDVCARRVQPPQYLGPAAGHRYPEDGSWLAFLDHLGVNGARSLSCVRLFGAGGLGLDASLAALSANTSADWGADLSGAPVRSAAQFAAAVAALRAPAGHVPADAGGATAPVAWARVDANMAFVSAADGVGSLLQGSTADTLRALSRLGLPPLLVQHIGCSSYAASSMDPADPAYWAERWELYKQGYAATSWAWRRNATRIELANEPDLTSNNRCISSVAYWLDFWTLRAAAAHAAFDDLNEDLAAGRASVANGLCAPPGCPGGALALNVMASAFAAANWAPPGAAAPRAPSRGVYAGLNGATLNATRLRFPPGARADTAWANEQSVSFHSYGQSGPGLGARVAAYARGTAPWRLPQPLAVTEHAALTGASWDTDESDADTPRRAARLGAQMLSVLGGVGGGVAADSYVFKFSATPYHKSAKRPGAQQGVTKSGLHWADNSAPPFAVGDTTLSGEVAALIAPVLAGGAQLAGCHLASGAADGDQPCVAALAPDGRSLTALLVNDGKAPLALSLDASALVPSPSHVLVSEVSAAGLYGEVAAFGAGDAQAPRGVLTRALPPYGALRVTLPMRACRLVPVPAAADTSLSAGAGAASAAGSAAAELAVGTSHTKAHDATAVALLAFPTAAVTVGTVAAVLTLTLARAPTADGHVYQVIGLGARPWAEANASWASAAFATGGATPRALRGINDNFVPLGPDAGNTVVGHLSVGADLQPGALLELDVTRYLRAVAGCGPTVSFLVVRRVRRNAATGNSAGVVAADSLAGSGMALRSRESESPPLLQLLQDAEAGGGEPLAECAPTTIGHGTAAPLSHLQPAAGSAIAVASLTSSGIRHRRASPSPGGAAVRRLPLAAAAAVLFAA